MPVARFTCYRDREGAEMLARQAADYGNTEALCHLAQAQEKAGDRDGAETLARQAADHGDLPPIHGRAWKVLQGLWPYGLDPDGTPTSRWQ